MAAMIRTSTVSGVRLAERMDFVVVEEAQQLGLDVEAEVADLVEEQRAAGGGADDAGERDVGAGEGAAAVAEQLALEHVARHRAAVERLERAVGAVRGAVDDAREHFLAGAGLAGEEDGDWCAGDAAGDAEQVGDLFGDPDALRRRRRAPRPATAPRAVSRRGGTDRAVRAVATSLRMAASVQWCSRSVSGRARRCQVSSRCCPIVRRSSAAAVSSAASASVSDHPSVAMRRVP